MYDELKPFVDALADNVAARATSMALIITTVGNILAGKPAQQHLVAASAKS
jgi:hypothetical protein